jgi:hypothetical protein
MVFILLETPAEKVEGHILTPNVHRRECAIESLVDVLALLVTKVKAADALHALMTVVAMADV